MENNNCKGILGKLFGHKFEARYSLSAAKISDGLKLEDADDLEYLREKTYEKDVCVRCGKTINKVEEI